MPVSCYICDKIFAKQGNLNRHVREVHQETPKPVSYSKDVWNSRCLEQNCDTSFRNIKDLVDHLQTAHSILFKTAFYQMQNWKEFEDWKSKVENLERSYYVLSTKTTSTLGEILYYNCNRNKRTYVPSSGEQSRLPKSQGSCKMDNLCTSQIKVTRENSKITVEWQKNHYGHTLDLQHIRLPKEQKQMVASKLINGVTQQRILDSTRDNIGKHLERINLLTSKDIRNIKTGFGVDVRDGIRDANDAFSIDLWVQECGLLLENPILFYKPQGSEHNTLKKDDFCLIIMNQFQKQMLLRFPNMITVDSTHGLNGYDFEMTTVMVIDEFHHGFPVAEMFSNRKDTEIQSIFFTSIKEAVALSNAVEYMCTEQQTRTFGEYFKNIYSHNFKKWAYCFRKNSSINTNMHIESMHKVIKYFYLERKTVKRLDKGLHAVLKYVRDKSAERLIRLTKGEITKQTKILSHGHTVAVQSSDNYLITDCNTYWKISKEEVSYTVQKAIEKKCCEQICFYCKVCNHMYSCDCPYFKERRLMCKHIHIVLTTIGIKDPDNLSHLDQPHRIYSQEHSSQHSNKDVTLNKMKNLLTKLGHKNYNALDDFTISQIHHHLLIISNLSDSPNFDESINFQLKNKSLKRLIDPQVRFKSTKKKRVQTSTSFQSTSRQEVESIKE